MKKNIKKSRYSIFIHGELINLCIPNLLAIKKDGWADWFNDIQELKATSHGIFPNNQKIQRKYFNNSKIDKTRIILLICDKPTNVAIGVISLQNINIQSKTAEIAINSSSKKRNNVHPLSFLEAMALITQHGFEEVGLNRIYAGQVYPMLKSWNKLLELIGFKTDGYFEKSFVRGHEIKDVINLSCVYDDYLKIKKIRGSLWGSKNIINNTLKKQPKNSFTEVFVKNLTTLKHKHFKYLYKKFKINKN